MGFEDAPSDIKKAIFEDNKKRLSAAGKKGAKVRAENFAIKKDSKRQRGIEHEYTRIFHESGEEAAEEFLKSVKE